MRELLSRCETANILGCSRSLVKRRIGKPCAIVINGRREVQAWRVGRVLAYREGQVLEPPDEPLAFYSLLESARRLETCRHKLKPLLGEPDCFYVSDGGKEWPLWSHQSLNAAFSLIQDARQSGNTSFDKRRAFKRRVSAKQRRRSQLRKMSWRSLMRPAPVSRVRFCAPRHVWADPSDVAKCSARK
jgi:hypothetical protein